MQALWLSLSETDPLQLDGIAWPPCDKVLHIHWSQALSRLRCGSDTDTVLWVLQVDGLQQVSADLRQALFDAKANVWVLVLLPFDRRSELAEWLDAGADRCVLWPCQNVLLSAQLRSLDRRSRAHDHSVSQFGSLCFDHATMTLLCNDHRIALTQREAQVMSLLMQRVGKMVSNNEVLLHIAKGESCVLRPAAVQLYMHRINRKIEPYGLHVHCVKLLGYRLSVKPPALPAELSTVWGPAAVSAHRPFASDEAHAPTPWGH